MEAGGQYSSNAQLKARYMTVNHVTIKATHKLNVHCYLKEVPVAHLNMLTTKLKMATMYIGQNSKVFQAIFPHIAF